MFKSALPWSDWKMGLAGFCRSCVLAIQFIKSKTNPWWSWQLQRKGQRLKREAECQKTSQVHGSSNRTYPYIADAFAALEIKLWFFFFRRESYSMNWEKSTWKFSPIRAEFADNWCIPPKNYPQWPQRWPWRTPISKNTNIQVWSLFSQQREEMATCKDSCAPSSETLPTPPSPVWFRHCPKHLPATSLTAGEVQRLAQHCWISWHGEAGTGKITAELQPVSLWQGKPICFQVYFILHCTLLIKWTFNPFEKPHGAQIHLANLSFPPGVYLD